MYRILRSYINYMTAWQQENFPTLPNKNPFDIVSHLLYCNGNGCNWLDMENGNDHLTMQMELKLGKQTGWVNFPFHNEPEKSVNFNQKNERDFSYYSKHEKFLVSTATGLAWKVNPALADIKLNDPEYWVQAVRENYFAALEESRKFATIWKRYQKRPEMISLGFPYDFNRPVDRASRRYVPVLNLLDFSKENNISHNSKIFKFTQIINEAVIKVYSEIIDDPEQQEILGEEIVAHIRNKLNHFIDFHSKNFFAIEF